MLSQGVLFLLGFGLIAAMPSPNSVESDLSLFFQNDLNWPTAPNHNGTILISTPSTNAQAIASCGQLYETLLPTNGTYFESDTGDLLRYLALDTFSPLQMYWVQSSSAECSAISLNGIQSVNCSDGLPAFCSQSAPYRPNTKTDMSTQYQVEVSSGNITVLGTRDSLSFHFIGIPYTDAFELWTYSNMYSGAGNITALTYGSPCTQIGYGSEDCLFLNVYTPYLPQNSVTSRNLKPVMLWIHGDEGSDGIFDGGNLASRSDVVTINYRLSTLGFLALENGLTNSNCGIADQTTALRWVHERVADFGGDPSCVTIFGQSAGAGSVRALLAAKPAFRLFAGAIAQSNLDGFGYASTYSNYYTIEQEYHVAAEPLIDISQNLTDTIINSGLSLVPPYNVYANITWDLANATDRVATDGEFRRLDQATVVAVAKNNIFPSVYAYEFDRSYMGYMPISDTCVPAATEGYPYGDPNLPYFRCHSGELYYVFGTLGQSSLPFRDWNDLVLSQVAVDAWSAFAKTFDPNPSFAYLATRGYVNTTEALVKYGLWERVTPDTVAPLRIFDVPLSSSPYLEQAQCDLLGYPLTFYGW